MEITFGDGALDAYTGLASHLQPGYTVALLNDGETVDDVEWVDWTDVSFVSADETGVRFRRVNEHGAAIYDDIGTTHVRPWGSIARIHVY